METKSVFFLGNSGVGKTSIINSFFDIPFTARFTPTEILESRTLQLEKMNIEFWEYPGQAFFTASKNKMNVDLIIYVYSSDSYTSFREIPEWRDVFNSNRKIPELIIENKSELAKKQWNEMARDLIGNSLLFTMSSRFESSNELLKKIISMLE